HVPAAGPVLPVLFLGQRGERQAIGSGWKPKSTYFPAAGDEQNQGLASGAFASLSRASGQGLGDQEIPAHVPDSHGVVGIQGNAKFPFLVFDPGLGQVRASQSILRVHGSFPLLELPWSRRIPTGPGGQTLLSA